MPLRGLPTKVRLSARFKRPNLLPAKHHALVPFAKEHGSVGTTGDGALFRRVDIENEDCIAFTFRIACDKLRDSCGRGYETASANDAAPWDEAATSRAWNTPQATMAK